MCGMRNSNRPFAFGLPASVLVALVGATAASVAGCATGLVDDSVDGGGIVVVTTHDGGADSSGPVIIVGGDTGTPPTVTVDTGVSPPPPPPASDSGFIGSDDATTMFFDGGSSDEDAGACEVFKPDQGCGTCLNENCCGVAGTCANDTTCTGCLGGTITDEATCENNAAFAALYSCLDASCAPTCEAGDGGTEEDAGGSSGGVPTTCNQAYGSVGCCGPDNTNYYCTGTTVTSKACTGTKVCGWSASEGYYACVAAPGGADPSEENPIDCQ
jgi:hypothetical protein